VLHQIGAGSSVGPAVPGEVGASRIGLLQPAEATGADLTTRVEGSDAEIVVTAHADDLARGYVDTAEIPDAGSILTMIIRYVGADGEVVTVTGGDYSDPEANQPGGDPITGQATRCPAGGVTVIGEPTTGHPTADDALKAAANTNDLTRLTFARESTSNVWIAGSSASPQAIIELAQPDGSAEWFIDMVTICDPDPFDGRVDQGTSAQFTALPYRLLIEDAPVGDIYVTDVAANAAAFETLWSQLGLVGPAPEVDFVSWHSCATTRWNVNLPNSETMAPFGMLDKMDDVNSLLARNRMQRMKHFLARFRGAIDAEVLHTILSDHGVATDSTHMRSMRMHPKHADGKQTCASMIADPARRTMRIYTEKPCANNVAKYDLSGLLTRREGEFQGDQDDEPRT
jgi:hypothetical protein